jgi:hypothetical protein
MPAQRSAVYERVVALAQRNSVFSAVGAHMSAHTTANPAHTHYTKGLSAVGTLVCAQNRTGTERHPELTTEGWLDSTVGALMATQTTAVTERLVALATDERIDSAVGAVTLSHPSQSKRRVPLGVRWALV